MPSVLRIRAKPFAALTFMLALLFCSLARVAAHEVLVDRDPEPRPIRDLELTIHHLELLVHQLVQQRVRAPRVLEDEPGALADADAIAPMRTPSRIPPAIARSGWTQVARTPVVFTPRSLVAVRGQHRGGHLLRGGGAALVGRERLAVAVHAR